MKHTLTLLIALLLAPVAALLAADEKPANAAGTVDVGVGIMDITPTEEVTLAGSPSPKRTSEVKTRLYVRALVLSAGGKKIAIVTLDTLKYPVEQVQRRALKSSRPQVSRPAMSSSAPRTRTSARFGPTIKISLQRRSPRPSRRRFVISPHAPWEWQRGKRMASANVGA